jgi:hypothetical protein
LADSGDPAEFAALAARMESDQTRVEYTNGCVRDVKATVGDIAHRLVDGTFFEKGDLSQHRR